MSTGEVTIVSRLKNNSIKRRFSSERSECSCFKRERHLQLCRRHDLLDGTFGKLSIGRLSPVRGRTFGSRRNHSHAAFAGFKSANVTDKSR